MIAKLGFSPHFTGVVFQFWLRRAQSALFLRKVEFSADVPEVPEIILSPPPRFPRDLVPDQLQALVFMVLLTGLYFIEIN